MNIPIESIPFEVYLLISILSMVIGLYLSLIRAKYYLEITILTTIFAPLPAIYAMYLKSGPTYYFYIVLMIYSFIILAVSLPAFTGFVPEFIGRIYRYTKMYYFSLLSRREFIGYTDIGRITDLMVIYTYLIIVILPIIVGVLLLLGHIIPAIITGVTISIMIVYLPKIIMLVTETEYTSGLDDELPQIIQILMIHHRSGETILQAFENIARAEDNLPYWSRLARAILINSRISGQGIHRTILDWVGGGGGTERVRNFLEGYVYTWIAGGDLEAYLKRWLDDEQVRWVARIRRYYNKIIGFAQIALILAVSPIAILLISFLNPVFGIITIQILVIILPVILYFIPSIYLNSLRPRMANTPGFKPETRYLLVALTVSAILIFLVPGDLLKLSSVILAMSIVLIPNEVGWQSSIKRIEEGVMRWVETSMHYMLAGATPIDAVKRAKELIKDKATLHLVNRLMYNIEVGRTAIKTPHPLITHVLHILGTGIMTGGISPDILHTNLNTIHQVKRTIEESRANAVSAVALGILSPIMIWITMGIGQWFVDVLAILPSDTAGVTIPFIFADINVDLIIFFLEVLSIVMVLTIGAIASKIYANYSHSPLIYMPLILTVTVLFIIGIDVMVEYFQTFLGF